MSESNSSSEFIELDATITSIDVRNLAKSSKPNLYTRMTLEFGELPAGVTVEADRRYQRRRQDGDEELKVGDRVSVQLERATIGDSSMARIYAIRRR